MTTEELAEVLANLAGDDPNNEQDWARHLLDACAQISAAGRGEVEAWWVEGDRP